MQEHSNTEQIQFSSLIVVSFVLLFMKISGIIQKHKYKSCLIFLSNIEQSKLKSCQVFVPICVDFY